MMLCSHEGTPPAVEATVTGRRSFSGKGIGILGFSLIAAADCKYSSRMCWRISSVNTFLPASPGAATGV